VRFHASASSAIEDVDRTAALAGRGFRLDREFCVEIEFEPRRLPGTDDALPPCTSCISATNCAAMVPSNRDCDEVPFSMALGNMAELGDGGDVGLADGGDNDPSGLTMGDCGGLNTAAAVGGDPADDEPAGASMVVLDPATCVAVIEEEAALVTVEPEGPATLPPEGTSEVVELVGANWIACLEPAGLRGSLSVLPFEFSLVAEWCEFSVVSFLEPFSCC